MRGRPELGAARRWVVKLGSSLLTGDGDGLRRDRIAGWMGEVAELRAAGREIALVSSGAVAEGMGRLGWSARPQVLHDLQAAAAVGQTGLVRAYEEGLAAHGLCCAQVLLTHEGLSDRTRYLNARTALRALLRLGAVPVINENDAVSTRELQLGDNDTLAALAANLVEADLLVILTDQAGLHDRDPRLHADARLIGEIALDDPRLGDCAGGGSGQLGRGGMRTKIEAARIAARGGAATWIAGGAAPGALGRIARGEDFGTLLPAGTRPLSARRQWLAGPHADRGRLRVDDGAERALRAGRSLLPVGVTAVEGSFAPGDVVGILGAAGGELARGIVNYGAADVRRIRGLRSEQLEAALGVVGEPELVHRDNLCPLWERADGAAA